MADCGARTAGQASDHRVPGCSLGFGLGASGSTAFVQRLRELSGSMVSTVAIEYRWAEGRNERFADIEAEFVKLNVDVIVTAGGAVRRIKQATSIIPIVFAVANNPVESGLVVSLARPGGNVTGLFGQHCRSGW